MTSPHRVCFVTFEVGPFTAGGIGTFMHNTLKAYSGRGPELHVLLLGKQKIDATAFDAVFPGVKLHTVDPDDYDASDDAAGMPPRAHMESRFQWYSHIAMRVLKRLESTHGAFDVIEFPDWGGYGFYSLQEKALGRAFGSSLLTVRLHATDSLLRHYETRPWGIDNLILADMERKAVADADLVVGHLDSTVDEYKRRYGFDAQWRAKAVVGLPPVMVGQRAETTIKVDPATTPILFTSKLQSIKRPEIFVQGVCAFALARPEYEGDIIITAFDFDQGYGQVIRDMVPKALEKRVRFVSGMPKEAREKLIARSVVVLPNAFEAFCFAAYEASLLGACVVLNGNNVSFGDGTPWVDRQNCRKFDGAAHNLATVLDDVFFPAAGAVALAPVKVEAPVVPYWEQVSTFRTTTVAAAARAGDAPELSVIVPFDGQAADLQRLVLDLLEEHAVQMEIIIADNASDDQHSQSVLRTLETLGDERGRVIRVQRAPARVRAASVLNRALASARGAVTTMIYPGMSFNPGFLDAACRALQRSTTFAAVMPMAAVTGARDSGSPVVGHFMPLGECLHVGFHLNRSCLHAFVMRTELMQRLRFDEQMSSDVEWDLCMRAVTQGARFIVTAQPEVRVPQSLASSLTWKSEYERRANAEIIRRGISAETAGGSIPVHVIGDAELVAAEWFILPTRAIVQADTAGGSLAHLNQIAAERDEWRRRYEELRGAESVRIALAVATRVKKLMPRNLTRLVMRRSAPKM